MRLQLALNVRNLEEAIDFYGKFFNAKPHKIRKGYANFAIESPPLKLVLMENPRAEGRLNHLGVEVYEQAEVDRAQQRFRKAHARLGFGHLPPLDASRFIAPRKPSPQAELF